MIPLEPESPFPPEQVIFTEIPAIGILNEAVKFTPIFPLKPSVILEEYSRLSISEVPNGLYIGNRLRPPLIRDYQ